MGFQLVRGSNTGFWKGHHRGRIDFSFALTSPALCGYARAILFRALVKAMPAKNTDEV
jgi:hypothetical protein